MSEDSTRANSMTNNGDTILDASFLIACITFVMPLIPLIVYLIGPGTIEGLGALLMGNIGWIWIGGYILLVILRVVSTARKTDKRDVDKVVICPRCLYGWPSSR